MRSNISKKRLLAAFTTLALAFSNLSGLELGAEATLLDIPEYTADAMLSSMTDNEIRKMELPDFVELLTDVRKYDRDSGEYVPAELVLPEDYSAVWINDDARSSQFEKNGEFGTSLSVYFRDTSNYTDDPDAPSWKDLELVIGSGKQLDYDNVKLNVRVFRNCNELPRYDAEIDFTGYTRKQLIDPKVYNTDVFLRELVVRDHATGEKIDYGFPEDASVWIDVGDGFDGYTKAPSKTEDDRRSNYFSELPEECRLIVGRGNTPFDSSPEGGNALFMLKVRNIPDVKDSFTVKAKDDDVRYSGYMSSGLYWRDYYKAPYMKLVTDSPKSSDTNYLKLELTEAQLEQYRKDRIAVNVYRLADFIDPDIPDSVYRDEVGSKPKPITAELLSEEGLETDLTTPQSEEDGYKNCFVITYTDLAENADGSLTDTGRIFDRDLVFIYIPRYTPEPYGLNVTCGDMTGKIDYSFYDNNSYLQMNAEDNKYFVFDMETVNTYIDFTLGSAAETWEDPEYRLSLGGFVSPGNYGEQDGFDKISEQSLIGVKKIELIDPERSLSPSFEYSADLAPLMSSKAKSSGTPYHDEYDDDTRLTVDEGEAIGFDMIDEDVEEDDVTPAPEPSDDDVDEFGEDDDNITETIDDTDGSTAAAPGSSITEDEDEHDDELPEDDGNVPADRNDFEESDELLDVTEVIGKGLVLDNNHAKFLVTTDDGYVFRWSPVFGFVQENSYSEQTEYGGGGPGSTIEIFGAPDKDVKDPLFNVDSLSVKSGGQTKKLKCKPVSFDPGNAKYQNNSGGYKLGYQTLIIADDISDEQMKRLVPSYSSESDISVYANGSKLNKGQAVDFSEGTVNFTVARDSGGDTGLSLDYGITAAKTVKGRSKLFVNAPDTLDMYFGDYFGGYYDLLLLNLGDKPLTGLNTYIRYPDGEERHNIFIDGYWTTGGEKNDTLEPFVDESGNFTSNMAKIRIFARVGEFDGTLVISCDGEPDREIRLRAHSSIYSLGYDISSVLNDAVKYVPYSGIIATYNKFKWVYESYEITEGRLPDGFELRPATGEIYGMPKKTGYFEFKVKRKIYSANLGRKISETEHTFSFTVKPNTNENVYNETDEAEGYGILLPIGTLTDPAEHRYEFCAPVDAELLARYEADPGNEALFREILDSIEDLGDLLFFSEGEFDGFVKVWFNGEELRDDEYSAVSGSTEVTVYEETVKAHIVDGTNTIAIEFRDEDGELKKTAQNVDFELVEKFFSNIAVRLTDGSGRALANTLVELHSRPVQLSTDSRGIARFTDIVSGHHTIYVNGGFCSFDIKKGSELGFGNNIITAPENADMMMNAESDGGTLRILSVGTETDIGDDDSAPGEDIKKNGEDTDPAADTGTETDGSDNKDNGAGDNNGNSGSGNASKTGKAPEGGEKGSTTPAAAPTEGAGEGSPVKQTGSDPAAYPANSGETPSGSTADDAPSANTGAPARYALTAVSLILFATAFRRKEER